MDSKYSFDDGKANFPLKGYTFVGLMTLYDPPREGVADAIANCKSAGIKVMMVTGNNYFHKFTIKKNRRPSIHC